MIFNPRNANTQALRHHLRVIMPMPTMFRVLIRLKLLLPNEHFYCVPPVKTMKSNGWEPSEHLSLGERTLDWYPGNQNFPPRRAGLSATHQLRLLPVQVLRSKVRLERWVLQDRILSLSHRRCARQRRHESIRFRKLWIFLFFFLQPCLVISWFSIPFWFRSYILNATQYLILFNASSCLFCVRLTSICP